MRVSPLLVGTSLKLVFPSEPNLHDASRKRTCTFGFTVTVSALCIDRVHRSRCCVALVVSGRVVGMS